ncbi:glycine receptor subunit alpha-2-like [Artemia franciscana]|uniref:glycine receptor subunit alpha-2-like n=1 Tax=Artemia franciscana TaxID=6661 RepID=UPI0032DB6BCB
MPLDDELPILFADDTVISLKAGNEEDLRAALETVAFNDEDNYILKYRQLFLQYIVDMYAKIESERLLYFRLNPTKLRSEQYIHLRDAVVNDGNTTNVGRLTIFPSLHTGSPRHMHEYTQDAIAFTGREEPIRFDEILPENPKLYDKMAPPRVDGNTTRVNFHLTVMSLDSIDESSMTYVVDVFFAQSWKDGRLRLPDNMTSEYRLLPVSWLKEIWHPDSFFKNAKRVTFHDMTIPNHYIWLYKDKTILYMVKLSLLLSCPMNFQNYPHDTQQCALKIESLSHTTDDLVFAWEDETPLVVDRIELPQLDLVENATGDCTHVYSTVVNVDTAATKPITLSRLLKAMSWVHTDFESFDSVL